jgi:hypothetical protein
VSDPYRQTIEGEWIRPALKGHLNQCCGCGLVHVLDFSVVDRITQDPIPNASVHLRTRIDRRETAAARRKLRSKK